MADIPVFVSSTFRDFHGERDVLVGPVRERLDELVAPLGCRVQLIDLRWGVDTTDDAEDEAQRHVLDVCLAEINRSRPLFVGLVGDRYGMVPDAAHARFVADRAGVPVSQPLAGASITHLEFGHGALWDSAPAGDHVVLLRTVRGPVPHEWADADPGRVTRFRSWLVERARARGSVRVVDYAATGTGAGVDLSVVEADGRRVGFEDLVVDCLREPVLERAREVIAADERSGEAGAARLFRDERSIMVGRDDLRDEVFARCVDGGRVLLLGESGSGKSTVVCAVEAALRSRGLPVVTQLVGVGTGGRSPLDVVNNLAVQVGNLVGDGVEVPGDLTLEGLQRWWSDLLAGAVARLGSLIVVTDALDQIQGVDDQDAVWPLGLLPVGVGLVCSSTNPAHAAILGVSGVETVPVGALPGVAARAAADAWSRASGRALPGVVLDVAGSRPRLPLWVRVAVDLLGDLDGDDFAAIAHEQDQAAAIASLLQREATGLPQDASELANTQLDRVGERVGPEPADLLLGLMAVARAGLSQAELLELLPQSLAKRQWVVAEARRVLGAQAREQDEAGRLSFTHALVRDAALARAPEDAHVRLARRLVVQDSYDRTGVLDLLWHVLHTTPVQVPEGPEHAAFALNARVPGSGPLLVRALAATDGAGLQVLAAMGSDALTHDGLEVLLSADESLGSALLTINHRASLAGINHQLARRLAEADPGNAQAARDVSVSLDNIGRVAMAAGDLTAARTAYTESLTTARRLADADLGNAQAARDVSVSLDNIGQVAMAAGDLTAARTAYTESLTTRRRLADADPGNAQAARDVSVSLDNIGEVAMAAGDLTAARTAYTESLTTARRLADADLGNAQAARDVSISLNNIGEVAMAAGDLTAARTAYTESLTTRRRLADADPGNAQAARDVSISLNNIGEVAMAAGDLTAARTAYTESLTTRRRLADADPGNAQAARDVSISLNNIGEVAMAAGDLTAARTAYTESLTTRRRLADADPGNAQAARDVSVSLNNIGRVAMAAGDLTAARTAYTESLTTRRRLADADLGNAQAARDVSVSLNNIGEVAMAAGDLTAARTAYTEMHDTLRRLAEADPGNAQAARDVSISLNNIGRVAMAAGDLTAARTAYTEMHDTLRRLAEADPGNAQAARDVSVSLDNIGEVAMAAGDLTAARTAYTESLTTARRLAEADPGNAQAARDVSVSLDNIGEVAMAAGDLTAARTAYTESLTTRRRLADADPGNAQAARDVSVSLWRLAELADAADAADGADSESSRRAWRLVAEEFEAQRRRGWIMPSDERAEEHARSRSGAARNDDGSTPRLGITEGLASQGLRFEEGSESRTVELFQRELAQRFSASLSVLLSEDSSEKYAELAGQPGSADRAEELLHEAIPSRPEILQDVQAALLEELKATARDDTIPALDTWPVSMHDLDTRAAVVLWCRGYRPSEQELRAASERAAEDAERRRWEEEVALLTPEQERAFLDLRARVEQEQAEPAALGALWASFHPDRGDRYLFHLGEAINALLGDQRAQPPQQP